MQFLTICVLYFICAIAAEPAYPAAKNNYKAQPEYHEGPPIPYTFGYAVKDEYTGNDYSHDTKSDGVIRTGSYRTLLPDGRVQIVNYKADSNGYVADVKYQGEAKYDYKPTSYKP